jgi:hypothetical protein
MTRGGHGVLVWKQEAERELAVSAGRGVWAWADLRRGYWRGRKSGDHDPVVH